MICYNLFRLYTLLYGTKYKSETILISISIKLYEPRIKKYNRKYTYLHVMWEVRNKRD